MTQKELEAEDYQTYVKNLEIIKLERIKENEEAKRMNK